MGEIADEHIDRMMEDGYFPGRYFMPRGSNKPRKKKSDPKDRSTWKTRDYPEKTFDMGFFPTAIPKPKTIVEPMEEAPAAPDVWDVNNEDSPF